jgi:hypothetical protein
MKNRIRLFLVELYGSQNCELVVVEYKAGQLPSESLQSLLIRISIVSHGHGNQVLGCLGTLSAWAADFAGQVDVCVTLNIPEPALERSIREAQWPFRVAVTVNSKPLGFGSNHNQALRDSDAAWFMIVNPDVRFRPAGGAQRLFSRLAGKYARHRWARLARAARPPRCLLRLRSTAADTSAGPGAFFETLVSRACFYACCGTN